MVALAQGGLYLARAVIALEARDKGMLGITLRYPYEVRNQADYFDDIPNEKIPKDMLELGTYIVETKAGHFHPEKFEDRYEDALKELLKKKQHGEKIKPPKERQAVEGDQSDGRAAPQRRSRRAATSGGTADARAPARKKERRSSARHKRSA